MCWTDSLFLHLLCSEMKIKMDRISLYFLTLGILLFLEITTIPTSAKTYDRCELARELLTRHNIPKDQIPTWVCIARHESEYNTSAINHDSGDHGLFQISHIYWCSPPGNGHACGLPCSSLENDDIEDDIGCAKRIYREHTGLSGDGFNAWVAYGIHCKGRNLQEYVKGCFDRQDDLDNYVIRKPSVIPKNYQYYTKSNSGFYENSYTSTIPTISLIQKTTPKITYKRPAFQSSFGTKYSFERPTTLRPIHRSTIKATTRSPIKLTTSRSSSARSALTKSTIPPLSEKNFPRNIAYRDISKHKSIEHPHTGSRFKYHINKSDAPILLSFPHFLYADDEYQHSVKGVKPSIDKHRTYVHLEPNTGTPLMGAKRIQFNMYARKIKNVPFLENYVTPRLVPILWLEEYVEITEDLYDILYYSYVEKTIIIDGVTYGLIALGIVVMVVCVGVSIYKSRKETHTV